MTQNYTDLLLVDRIIEDFLARTKETKCTDFKDTADKVQSAFKMYLNVSPTVTSWSSASDEFSLIFEVVSINDSERDIF